MANYTFDHTMPTDWSVLDEVIREQCIELYHHEVPTTAWDYFSSLDVFRVPRKNIVIATLSSGSQADICGYIIAYSDYTVCQVLSHYVLSQHKTVETESILFRELIRLVEARGIYLYTTTDPRMVKNPIFMQHFTPAPHVNVSLFYTKDRLFSVTKEGNPDLRVHLDKILDRSGRYHELLYMDSKGSSNLYSSDSALLALEFHTYLLSHMNLVAIVTNHHLLSAFCDYVFGCIAEGHRDLESIITNYLSHSNILTIE